MMKKLSVGLATAVGSAAAVLGLGLTSAYADISVEVEVQAHLTALGYEPGGVDGAFGRGSRRALQKFEREVGLPADGRIDDEARRALLSRVESDQERRFGRVLSGYWGTSQRCRGRENRIRVQGYTVTHQPIWSDQSFEYVALPKPNSTELTVVWDSNNRQRGRDVIFERSSNSLRVPELNMFGVDDCRRFGIRDQVAFVPNDRAPATTPGNGGGATSAELDQATIAELIAALQSRISNDSAAAQAQAREIDQLRTSNQRLERRMETFAERNNERLREVQSLRSQLATSQERVSELETALNRRGFGGNSGGNRNARIRQLEAQLTDTQAQLNFANQQIFQLQQANQQLGQQLQARGQPTQTTTGTATITGEDALQIIIPQLLQGLTGN